MTGRTALAIAAILHDYGRDEVNHEVEAILLHQREEIARLNHDRSRMLELLAIIHRDGGQYVAQHGIEKACGDAGAQVSTWLETINNADALCEQARIAEREACANLCEDAFDKYPKDDNRALGALYCAGIIRIRSSTNHHINRYDR